MASQRFSKEGRLVFPDTRPPKKEPPAQAGDNIPEIAKEIRTLYIIQQVFCPNQHNLIEKNHVISGHPGIRLRYRSRDGRVAEVVLSAVLGDAQSRIVKGELRMGETVDIHCPICDVKLPILTHDSHPESRDDACVARVMLFLTPDLDYSRAIVFCNKVGIVRSYIQHSGKIIQSFYEEMPDFG